MRWDMSESRTLDISDLLDISEVQRNRKHGAIIGSGSFADIYKCHHKDGMTVAVKVIRESSINQNKMKDQETADKVMNVSTGNLYSLSCPAQSNNIASFITEYHWGGQCLAQTDAPEYHTYAGGLLSRQ